MQITMKNIKKSQFSAHLRVPFFTIVIIFIIAVSNISNTSILFLFAKGIIILSIYFYIIIKKQKNIFTQIVEEIMPIKYFLLLVILSIASLTFTSNFNYGLNKTLNLVLNIPILLILKHFFDISNITKRDNIIFTISIIGIISFFLIILIDPFDQSKLYVFEFTRWSHVIFSRMMSLLFFIVLITFIYSSKKKKQIGLTLIMSLMLYQIYYANLRAATIGVIIFGISIIIYALIKSQLNFNKSMLLFASLGITVFFISITPTSEYFENRYSEPTKIFNGDVPEDGGINARLIAYKKSIEIIKENPIIGVGVGGFNAYKNDEFLTWIKYPHNIFLEFQVELGLFGSLFFFFYLIKTFKILYAINIHILIVWLFTIWLALFAKDISSNLLVFLPLALNDMKVKVQTEVE